LFKTEVIHNRARNLRAVQQRAVQLLLGHTKVENIVRYLGSEVNDALEIAEQTEVLAVPKGRGRLIGGRGASAELLSPSRTEQQR